MFKELCLCTVDVEKPMITCPSNVSINTSSGQDYGTANFNNASAVDNSGASPSVECSVYGPANFTLPELSPAVTDQL